MERFIPFLLRMLSTIITGISPELRETLEGAMNGLEKRAKSTPNHFDDILVGFLKTLLGF